MPDSMIQKSSDASLRITILTQVMYSILEPLRQIWDNVYTCIIVILMHRIYDNFTTISPQNRRKLSKKTQEH